MEVTPEQFQEFGIDYLYHFTHVKNLASIRSRGLVSHNRAHGSGYVREDISNREVNQIRAYKAAFGKPLHDYVPLYFVPRNPMLYALKHLQNNIAILCLKKELLCREGAIFTDGNAANGPTKFFDNAQYLKDLDWDCIEAQWWTDFPDGRRKKCAEVLIPDYISFYEVQKVIANTRRNLDLVLQTLRQEALRKPMPPHKIMTQVQPGMFFND